MSPKKPKIRHKDARAGTDNRKPPRPDLDWWKPAFLKVFSERGHVTDAARVAGISRQTAYQHRRTDEKFAKAWAEAEEIVAETLEAEAFRRAVEGVEKNVFYRDKKIDTVREYSDRLLIVLLRARNPKRFTPEKKLEHSGDVGQARILITIPDNGRDPELVDAKPVIEGEAHLIEESPALPP